MPLTFEFQFGGGGGVHDFGRFYVHEIAISPTRCFQLGEYGISQYTSNSPNLFHLPEVFPGAIMGQESNAAFLDASNHLSPLVKLTLFGECAPNVPLTPLHSPV